MHLEIETFDSGVFVKYNKEEYFFNAPTLADLNPLTLCLKWRCTCSFTLGILGLQLCRTVMYGAEVIPSIL